MAINPATAGTVPQITGAIRQASQSTGISFEYLLTTAQIESNLNPSAQASTSSAKGLYQFIDQTWLGTMKQDGAAFGFGRYADAITRTSDGRYGVSDPAMRAAILRLRSDPKASAMLAGALTRNNSSLVGANIGRQPTNGELYIAHFLGADGAGKLINAASSKPRASAAAMFPHAAAANRSIFYDRSGRARTVGEVYGKLTRLFEVARVAAFAPKRGVIDSGDTLPSAKVTPVQAASLPPLIAQATRVAAAEMRAPPLPEPHPIPPAPIPYPASRTRSPSPDTAGTTQAFAKASERLPAPLPARPPFESMFTDRVGEPLAQTVNHLWGPPSRGGVQSTAQAGQVFDLFTDVRPNSRKYLGDKA